MTLALTLTDNYLDDGIDIDWEYPSHAEQGGRPQDKANFVLLLRELRAAITVDAEVSLAAHIQKWRLMAS